MTRRSIIVGYWGGEGQVRAETRVHLVPCGSDEPSWTCTQIWFQARMPDYSLNWTERSIAIQGGPRCLLCSSSTRSWPCRGRRPFGHESTMENWPFGTDARQSAEQSGKIPTQSRPFYWTRYLRNLFLLFFPSFVTLSRGLFNVDPNQQNN